MSNYPQFFLLNRRFPNKRRGVFTKISFITISVIILIS
jgi:hypothetical protein